MNISQTRTRLGRQDGSISVEFALMLVFFFMPMLIGTIPRARNARTIANVRQYYNAIELYKLQNGTYPSVPGEARVSFSMVCLGRGYRSGTCGNVTGNSVYESNDFLTKLGTVSNTLANSVVNTEEGSVQNESFVGAVYGIDVVGPPAPHSGHGRVIEWFLEGRDQKCVVPYSYAYNTDKNTACELYLEDYD